MSIRPLRDLVYLRESTQHGWHHDENTGSTIILARNQAPKVCSGTVISIGPKVQDLTVGETVYFAQHCGTAVGDGCLMMPASMLLLAGEGRVSS
jgi:co-chaperonin GroES (HSP10)